MFSFVVNWKFSSPERVKIVIRCTPSVPKDTHTPLAIMSETGEIQKLISYYSEDYEIFNIIIVIKAISAPDSHTEWAAITSGLKVRSSKYSKGLFPII